MSSGPLVYLDEAGDSGFKVQTGSSPTLVVAIAIFDRPADAEVTAARICELRRALTGTDRYQFHFSDTSRKWREAFFRTGAPLPFRVRAIVMRKEDIYEGSMLRQRGDYFYNYTVKLLLKHTFGTLIDAKVFVDGHAGRESLRAMTAYLRKECNTGDQRIIRDIRFVPKRENNVLVQLADMVTSGLARAYRLDKDDCTVYRRLMKPRLQDVWEFGGGHK